MSLLGASLRSYRPSHTARDAVESPTLNAAFDAGFCAALGKPYITLHDEAIIHPLKEVDASAMAWARTPEQVVEILKYVASGQ